MDLALDIISRLPFEPNEQQMKTAVALARFVAPAPDDFRASDERVFVLNGYAGTGKTSLVGAMVKALVERKVPVMLLAPTGRAAKVFSAGADYPAATIHRKIYKHDLLGTSSFASPVPRDNTLQNAVFIVDEASMIGSETETGSNLLTDLIHYVYSGPGCRLILMGDTAQLPPVGQSESPAMQRDSLRDYGLKVTSVTLTDVARQAAQSGILANATRLRRVLALPEEKMPADLPLVTDGLPDVKAIPGDDLPEVLEALYRADGPEETIVITWSNLSAVQLNTGIRAAVLEREEELAPGDLLIAARNNYHWTRKVKGLDFIANGEILRLVSVTGTERRYGLRFADVVLEPVSQPGTEFEAKIILNCLGDPAAALGSDAMRRLYQGVYADPDLMPPTAPNDMRVRLMRQSAYWNALQVKYAYAVTCHKAQGGQWQNVIVDLSYIPPEQQRHDLCRWLYTAITRARTRLWLVNLPGQN